MIFFFKQKTAYEMRISDWSSDVCSSDLIARDPSFALALARLSNAQSLLAWFGPEDIDADALTAQARTNAERSLALNPKLADGFIAMGYSDYYCRLDYDAALTAFATAPRLRPHDPGAVAAARNV